MPLRGRLTLLHEVLRRSRLRAKLARRERQSLLGLTVECRVLNEGIDEDPHVVLDLCRLYRGRLVLLRDEGDEVEDGFVFDVKSEDKRESIVEEGGK